MSRIAALALALTTALSLSAVACSNDSSEDAATGDDALSSTGHGSDEWFYSGSLPTLENASITASLAGQTNHVSGLLPVGVTIPDLPHVKTKQVNGRTQVDVVYPIATAAPDHDNSSPGTYSFYDAMPYRPNGNAYTPSLGNHFVTWGGFPFLAYNDGIAFHGPITDEASESHSDMNVWYLRRGRVSSGCNRMMGEHVIELAQLIGIDMHKLYKAAGHYTPTTTAKVKVISDYDMYEGKYIDVDYPTDVGMTRPGVAKGADNVVMFGSWVGTVTPDGSDLPADMKWEGGVSGQLYDFQEHMVRGNVCSMPTNMLAELGTVAAKTGGKLPADFCQKKFACDDAKGRTCKPSEI